MPLGGARRPESMARIRLQRADRRSRRLKLPGQLEPPPSRNFPPSHPIHHPNSASPKYNRISRFSLLFFPVCQTFLEALNHCVEKKTQLFETIVTFDWVWGKVIAFPALLKCNVLKTSGTQRKRGKARTSSKKKHEVREAWRSFEKVRDRNSRRWKLEVHRIRG